MEPHSNTIVAAFLAIPLYNSVLLYEFQGEWLKSQKNQKILLDYGQIILLLDSGGVTEYRVP